MLTLTDTTCDTEWRRRANCADPDVNPDWFFPGDNAAQTKENYKQAAAVCAGCPVSTECSEDMTQVIVNGENQGEILPVGYQAGTTWGERSGRNAQRAAYHQANKEAMLAKRNARDRARRAAESPEERAARLDRRYGR